MASKVQIGGYMTVERLSVKRLRLISKVLDSKHFVILMYPAGDSALMDAVLTFRRLNCRYLLGETWFMEIDGYDGLPRVVSVSFKTVNWSRYKRMLFCSGIDRGFKLRCLKDGFASIDVSPDCGLKRSFVFCEDDKNGELKSSFAELIAKV
jgi:hypothetical protein